jgi:molybdopterin molybdotransferase
MLLLEDAQHIIQNLSFSKKTTTVSLTDSLGMILCEKVISDINMPPFDKSAVDGFACKRSDLGNNLKIIDFVPAGSVPDKRIVSGTCIKIMTGATVPEGADCVIMVEHTEKIKEDIVRFTGKDTKDNICYRGEDIKNGDMVMSPGNLLKPASIAVLASAGKKNVQVYQPPYIALVSTGDELAEPQGLLKDGQIRNSNAYNIMGQISQAPAKYQYLGIVRDNKADLKQIIYQALKDNDLLILTGGVSMGDRDYIPEIMQEEGFKIHFDRLAIQPGKPVLFAEKGDKYCFGLSGNPVSSLLQFELLVRPFIYRFMHFNYELSIVNLTLNKNMNRKKTERQQFFPVKISDGVAQIIEFHGSAHIAAMHYADGFGFFPRGISELEGGSIVPVLTLK